MNLIIKKWPKGIIKFCLIGLLSSCNGDWLNVNDNPNSPAEPDIELLVPSFQIATAQVLADRLDLIGTLSQVWEGTESQYDLGSESGPQFAYEEFFTDALINAQRVIQDAPLNDPPLSTHLGMAKVMKTYVYYIMIELWGAVPYDEALLGAEGPDAPTWENGAQIYPKLLTLLNEGIADLQAGGVAPQRDVIYQGNVDKWARFANTLKMKMAINLGDVAMIQQAISAGVIESNEDNAIFEFGMGLAPENRHKLHQEHYSPGKDFYMSNTLMWKMLRGYGAEGEMDAVDPRMRYYFYRQILDFDEALAAGRVVPDDFPCFNYGERHNDPDTWGSQCAYGYIGNGYTGREQADGSGIPNDGSTRTTFGIYPIGGLFDNNSAKVVNQSDISRGGIYPFFTAAMSKFMQAEAVLLLGMAGDARQLLEDGVRASIEHVMDFGEGASNFDANYAPTDDDIDLYVRNVLAKYDASSDNNVTGGFGSKLDVVMDQWYIASFGNSTEAFSNFRRVKLPFIRPANNGSGRMGLVPVNPYPRRLPFPGSELATNPNAPDPDETLWFRDPIFWDDNNYPSNF